MCCFSWCFPRGSRDHHIAPVHVLWHCGKRSGRSAAKKQEAASNLQAESIPNIKAFLNQYLPSRLVVPGCPPMPHPQEIRPLLTDYEGIMVVSLHKALFLGKDGIGGAPLSDGTTKSTSSTC